MLSWGVGEKLLLRCGRSDGEEGLVVVHCCVDGGVFDASFIFDAFFTLAFCAVCEVCAFVLVVGIGVGGFPLELSRLAIFPLLLLTQVFLVLWGEFFYALYLLLLPVALGYWRH